MGTLWQTGFMFSCAKQIYMQNKVNLRVSPGGICKVVNIPLHVTHSEWLFAANPQGNQLWAFHTCSKQKGFSWDSEQPSFPGFSIPGSFWINQNHDKWLLKIKHTVFSSDVLGNII